ncbi:zinc-binding alcohol dehydrogenase family protein [Phanerochaete sordida]|uniref:Zinc-binding alcohol dehydrogenase family protein n=1 Tax=Phanerochaete sordida TaxID=48140 RepID=A0A9P3G899_9APHY|nr:zinc-binding alcohol dehydrogenase family protein [Phanerochaete sordida]
MSTQKALFLEKLGGKLFIQDRDIPEPGAGEVLIEIHAAGLNPADWKINGFEGILKEFPAILGTDGAGIVKKVGTGVTNVAVGDKVLFQGAYDNRHATFQQYAVTEAEIVAKIPANLTFEQAASIPLALATAALALYNQQPHGIGFDAPWEAAGRGKYAGEPIVILGGSSSVGQHAIQLARLSGFSPIITTASLHNSALLKSLGATHVIDRAAPLSELAQAVQAITSKPITVVYDAISDPDTQNAGYDMLAPGGTLVIVHCRAVDAAKVTSEKEILYILGSVQFAEHRAIGKSLYARLTGLLESGEIKPNQVEVLPNGLAGIPDGLAKLKAGISALKFIARPQESA